MIPATCPQDKNTPLDPCLCWANIELKAPPCRECERGKTMLKQGKGRTT